MEHNLSCAAHRPPRQTSKGPLYPLDPVSGEKLMHASQVTGHWLIESDLYVTDGVTLQVKG